MTEPVGDLRVIREALERAGVHSADEGTSSWVEGDALAALDRVEAALRGVANPRRARTRQGDTVNAPTRKQYEYLRILANGSARVVGPKRETEMYLRRGWVTAELTTERPYPYAWIRITPDGLRALAVAIERYGLPELRPKKPAGEKTT